MSNPDWEDVRLTILVLPNWKVGLVIYSGKGDLSRIDSSSALHVSIRSP